MTNNHYFSGRISISPPLNEQEIHFMMAFNHSRRMKRENGPYYVHGSGILGQGDDKDIIDYNTPPEDQPSLWCNWTVSQDGKNIQYDDGNKFHYFVEWMEYIIKHFLGHNPIAKERDPRMSFLTSHTLNGVIIVKDEDTNTFLFLVVENNIVNQTMENEKAYEWNHKPKRLINFKSNL